jgi:hypothetical protein
MAIDDIHPHPVKSGLDHTGGWYRKASAQPRGSIDLMTERILESPNILDTLKRSNPPAYHRLTKQILEGGGIPIQEALYTGLPEQMYTPMKRWLYDEMHPCGDEELPQWIKNAMMHHFTYPPPWAVQWMRNSLECVGGPPDWVMEGIVRHMDDNSGYGGNPPGWAEWWVLDELWGNPKHPQLRPPLERTIARHRVAGGRYSRRQEILWFEPNPELMERLEL